MYIHKNDAKLAKDELLYYYRKIVTSIHTQLHLQGLMLDEFLAAPSSLAKVRFLFCAIPDISLSTLLLFVFKILKKTHKHS
jgi:hypothetical protein